MRVKIYFIGVVILLISCKRKASVDIILYHGHIYTMNAPSDTIQAIAIKDGKIIQTGNNQEIIALKSTSTLLIDLYGATVFPGFTDAHIHPISGGLALLECELTDLVTQSLILDSLRRYAENHSDLAWIKGENMWLAAFKDGNPSKTLLDSIIPDRPVFVTSSDGHNAWVNSKALQLAGISKESPDPPYGKIVRIRDTREPSGTLRETAIDLVKHLLPKYTDQDRKSALLKAIALANQYGLTTLNEASAHSIDVQTYYTLQKENKLNAHINLSLYCEISKGISAVKETIALRDEWVNVPGDIKTNEVKLFMDGVVEGKTAAMLSDYADDHHNGIANASMDTASDVMVELDKAGMQIHVHSIGDRATRMTLDAFDHAIKANGRRDSRHHIAHLHVIHPDDYPRFKSLNVIANFQALWATWEDTYMTELNRPFLGVERMEWQYPMGSLLNAGATLVFGSDWDVSTQNPFYALQVAVTRRGPDSIKRDAWTPQHLIDRYAVIHGYTVNGAFLTFREKEIGTLGAGKWADLIVLDQDILTCDIFSIYKTKVLKTFFKGKQVYAQE